MSTFQAPVHAPRFRVNDDAPQVACVRGARATQEDRFIILHVQRKKNGVVREHGWLMAVIDGHGGPEAVEAVEALLPHAFNTAFKVHHEDYRKVMAKAVELLANDPKIKLQVSAGTTLSMAYVADELPSVYIAHLGDSPVILFDNGGHILFRTEEHNIITNPREVERVRELSLKRHGQDRIRVTESVSKSGLHRPQYIKDKRMEDDFHGMFNEIMDVIEQARRAEGADYPLVDSTEDSRTLARIMKGKGIQNTAQLGALPFDAIISREPEVSQVLIDPNRLPVHLMLATDGILEIMPGADPHEVEREIARLVAVEKNTPAELVQKAGGDRARDNTTVILYTIPTVHHH